MPHLSAELSESSTVPSRLGWLADERRFWTITTVILGLFAVCKGLRQPSTWALTQAQIDYSHGLIKRGLLGSVYGAFGIHHVVPLGVASFLELAVFFVALALFAVRSGLGRRFGSPAVLAVFASSYAVTYLTHLVGYTDLLDGTLAVCLLLVSSATRRFWLGLVVVPVAMLVHENFLLLFLPPVLFSFYLDAVTAGPGLLRRRCFVAGGVLAAIALGFALMLSLRPNLPPETVDQFQEEIAARVNFPVNDQVMDTLTKSLAANVHGVLVVMKQEQWWSKFLSSICNLLPLFLLGMHWVRRAVEEIEQQYGLAVRRGFFWAAAVLSSVAPLAIYALGWDCARWNTSCVLATFLTLGLLSRRLPGRVFALAAWERHAIILLLAVNMASGFGFFDMFQIHPYPFFPGLMPPGP